jgi:hypothetical protein
LVATSQLIREYIRNGNITDYGIALYTIGYALQTNEADELPRKKLILQQSRLSSVSWRILLAERKLLFHEW